MDGVRKQSHLSRRAHERLAALEASTAQSDGKLTAAFARSTQSLAPGEAETRMMAHLANMATAAAFGIATSDEDAASDGTSGAASNPEEQLAQAELLDLISQDPQ